MSNLFESEFAEHIAVATASRDALRGPFESVLAVCTQAIKNQGKLLFFGNGGSAADAQHLATELTIRYKRDRQPIAALALTTDTSALTAAGNDLGFDKIFSRQIEALGRHGDIAIGITTSGRSPNILRAFESAQGRNELLGLSDQDVELLLVLVGAETGAHASRYLAREDRRTAAQ